MKLLLGILTVISILCIVILYCALIISARNDNRNTNTEKEKFTTDNQLCPKCKTGKYSYELDPTSEVCQYINCYKGGRCPYFKPLDK